MEVRMNGGDKMKEVDFNYKV